MLEPEKSEKLVMLAKMMGISPETLSKMQEELSKSKESAPQDKPEGVAVVKVASVSSKEGPSAIGKLCEMEDKDIDALSEDDAKSMLAKIRDEYGSEKPKSPADAPSKPTLQDSMAGVRSF